MRKAIHSGICSRPLILPWTMPRSIPTKCSSYMASAHGTKLTDGEEGVKHLLEALSTWQETSEMQTYERFERLIYKTLQKSDESTMSYANRMSVAFQEVGDAVTIGEVKAFLLLRQSALGGEDKRKIISMTNGALDYHKIDMAMRALSSKVLSDGHGSSRKKVYPVNFVEEESSEHPEDALMTSADEYLDEETALQWLLHEGDEQALLVQEFEDQVVDVVQESPELAMAFSAYQDARARIRDRIRSRGFWPTKGGSKGKWSSSSTWSSSGSKGKGKSMGKRSTLAERIAMSHCRLCGQKGRWKRECPRRDTSSTNDTNLAYIDEETDMDDAFVDRLPPLRSLEARNCTEDFVFVACHFWSKSSHEGEGQKNRHLRSHLGEFREHFQVVLASMADSDVRTVSRHGVVGIIDTGASKSVVGQNRVQALVDSLPEACRNRVARRPSDTVFRFGNNGTLRSLEALYLPFGARWMKVEVVAGSTPFLVSNAFLFALEAILDIAKSELVIPSWSKSFRLTRNEKGLMTVNLVEMIAVAEAKDSDRRPTHEVISFASSQGEPHEKGLPDMIETHETSRSQNTEQTHTAAAKVAQTTPILPDLPRRFWSYLLLIMAGYSGYKEKTTDIGQSLLDAQSPPTPLWDAPLAGEEDPEMDVPKIKNLEELPGHPPGINSLREWGETVFPEGKHVQKTFRWVYEQDQQYTNFMIKNTRLKTAWTKSFQGYCKHRMAIASKHNSLIHQRQLEAILKAKSQTGESGDLLSKEPEMAGKGSTDWELLSARQEGNQSSSASKRHLASEMKMETEVTLATKEEAAAKIAILQREIEKLTKQFEM